MAPVSGWGRLWGSADEGEQRRCYGSIDATETTPLNPSASREAFEVAPPSSPGPRQRATSRANGTTTNNGTLFYSNSWTVVSVDRRDDEVEVRIFSGYGRVCTVFGLWAIVNAVAWHLAQVLRAVEHWHVMGVAAASSVVLVVAVFHMKISQILWETANLDRLVVTDSGAAIDRIYPCKLGTGRSIRVDGRLQAQVRNKRAS